MNDQQSFINFKFQNTSPCFYFRLIERDAYLLKVEPLKILSFFLVASEATLLLSLYVDKDIILRPEC